MAHADNSNVYDVAFEMLVARTGQNDLALQLRTGDEDFEQGERWPQACKRFASVALMLYGERPRTNLTRWQTCPQVPAPSTNAIHLSFVFRVPDFRPNNTTVQRMPVGGSGQGVGAAGSRLVTARTTRTADSEPRQFSCSLALPVRWSRCAIRSPRLRPLAPAWLNPHLTRAKILAARVSHGFRARSLARGGAHLQYV